MEYLHYSASMSFNTTLPPLVRIHIPLPVRQSESSTNTSLVWPAFLPGSSNLEEHSFKDQVSYPACGDASARIDDSTHLWSTSLMTGITHSNLFIDPEHTPERFLAIKNSNGFPAPSQKFAVQPSNPAKQDARQHGFQFIQIHKASGKADQTAESNLRSYLMKKYHQNRRQNDNRGVGTTRRRKQSKYTHLNLFLRPEPHSLLSTPCFRPPTEPQRKISYSANSQSRVLSSRNLSQSDIGTSSFHLATNNHKIELDFISSCKLVCVQCGKLVLLHSRVDGATQLPPLPLSRVPSSLASGSHDPFDSLPISVDHRMHTMLHHCKSQHASIYP